MPGPTCFPAAALEQAAAGFARLDQALSGHPLREAFLYRTRLEAVRRQAAADGTQIDPWHLAATLEGLRLHMAAALRIIDRGAIFAAARQALDLHQWLTAPDFDQEGEIQAAADALAQADGPGVLLATAHCFHGWLEAGGARAPFRAALVRHWTARGLLAVPVPVTGPRAFAADAPGDRAGWSAAFLQALASEAADYLRLLRELERTWFAARARVANRRRNSRAAMAIDVLAAAPMVSATSLAMALDMSIKGALTLLDEFLAEGLVVEVTHRAKRRLFGLTGLAPLRAETTAPRRPVPGRGRGRPPNVVIPDAPPETVELPELTPLQRVAIDFSDLDHWMAHADQAIRKARVMLRRETGGAEERAAA